MKISTHLRNSWLLSTLVFFLPLTMHAYMGTLSRYMADDYCSASIARTEGIVGGARYWYLNWTGRYSANYLDSLFGALGTGVVPFVTSAILLIWLALLSITLMQVSISGRDRLSIWPATGLAGLIIVTALNMSPATSESLYWGQGMRSVIPPLILFTAFIGLVLYVNRQNQRPRRFWIWISLSATLCLVAAGFSETFSAFLVTVLLFTIVVGQFQSNVRLSRWARLLLVVGFCSSAVGMLIVIAAPGNEIRQENFPAPPAVLELVEITLRSLAMFVRWTLASRLAVASLAILTISAVLLGWSTAANDRDHENEGNHSIWDIVWPPVVGIALIVVCLAPAAYGMSAPPPARTWIIPYYALVLLAAVWGYLTGRFMANQSSFPLGANGDLSRSLTMYIVILLLFALATVSTVRIVQFLPMQNRYAQWWDTADATIKNAISSGDALVSIAPPPEHWAGLDDIESNADSWVNQCVSEFYGISVVADADAVDAIGQ